MSPCVGCGGSHRAAGGGAARGIGGSRGGGAAARPPGHRSAGDKGEPTMHQGEPSCKTAESFWCSIVAQGQTVSCVSSHCPCCGLDHTAKLCRRYAHAASDILRVEYSAVLSCPQPRMRDPRACRSWRRCAWNWPARGKRWRERRGSSRTSWRQPSRAARSSCSGSMPRCRTLLVETPAC